MSSQDQVKQPKKAQPPQSEPSPWTEPFQRAYDSHEQGQADDSAAQNAEATATKCTHAAGSHPHTDEATHDALSTIFNG